MSTLCLNGIKCGGKLSYYSRSIFSIGNFNTTSRTALHLPFHIALVLLLEGASQFIIWARIVESANSIINKVLATEQKALTGDPTSEEVSKKLGDLVIPFLNKYQPLDVLETMKSVNETLEEIADMPDSFWSSDPSPDDSKLQHYLSDLAELTNTMINAIYNAFGFNPPEDQEEMPKTEFWQTQAAVASAKRFILVVSAADALFSPCNFDSKPLTK